MKAYLRRSSAVHAEPMTRGEFWGTKEVQISFSSIEDANKGGYAVYFPDGDKRWMTKEDFEENYKEI